MDGGTPCIAAGWWDSAAIWVNGPLPWPPQGCCTWPRVGRGSLLLQASRGNPHPGQMESGDFQGDFSRSMHKLCIRPCGHMGVWGVGAGLLGRACVIRKSCAHAWWGEVAGDPVFHPNLPPDLCIRLRAGRVGQGCCEDSVPFLKEVANRPVVLGGHNLVMSCL